MKKKVEHLVRDIQTALIQLRTAKKEGQLVLSESALLRYFSLSALYTAQGVPEGLTFFAIPAWLAMNGKSALEIGTFVGAIGLPWSFKILMAPLMDRFTYLPMGRKRPWVILGQLGLILSLLITALIPDPLDNLTLLSAAGFCISFFGAFQDVAVDGMTIDVVPVNEQARANGLMWGSKTLGISLSLLISTWLINTYGFRFAPLLIALVIAIILIVPVRFRENRGERFMPWGLGEASQKYIQTQAVNLKSIFKNLLQVFFLPTGLVLGVAIFINGIGNGIMETLLPIFTIQEVGWTDSYFSQVMSFANIVAGIAGMFVGGALVDFFGKIRMMSVYLILFVLLTASFILLKAFWAETFFVPGFIMTYFILYTFMCIAIFATAMELSWNRIAATQFTLYMAIYNLGRALGASSLGEIKNYLVAWDYVILVYTLSALIVLSLLAFMRTKRHRELVGHLENKFLQS